jgi:hypothetical protein
MGAASGGIAELATATAAAPDLMEDRLGTSSESIDL